jgi:hypothetical protein
MEATFNITTKELTIVGKNISPVAVVIEELGEWGCINNLKGKPLYDFQLDFDDSIDDSEKPERNFKNYSLQYVNLVREKGKKTLTIGQNWKIAELTVICGKKNQKVLGVNKSHE